MRLAAPMHTVGSICVVVSADDQSMLLVRQPYRTHWGLPGGLLKRREDTAAAAHREVREEVGVAISLVGEPVIVVEPAARRVDVVYMARVVGDEAAARPSSPEILAAEWHPVASLPTIQHETAQAIVALGRAGRLPESFAEPLASISASYPSVGITSGV